MKPRSTRSTAADVLAYLLGLAILLATGVGIIAAPLWCLGRIL
jgi:hypothetical protein